MRTTLLALLVAGLVMAQDTPKNGGELVGSWTVVSALKGGEKTPEEALKSMLVTFDEKTVTIKHGDNVEKANYKIDPSAKVKTLDITPEKAPKGVVVEGIYELKGDTLKIVWNKGKGRPTDFKGTGSDQAYMELKRKK